MAPMSASNTASALIAAAFVSHFLATGRLREHGAALRFPSAFLAPGEEAIFKTNFPNGGMAPAAGAIRSEAAEPDIRRAAEILRTSHASSGHSREGAIADRPTSGGGRICHARRCEKNGGSGARKRGTPAAGEQRVVPVSQPYQLANRIMAKSSSTVRALPARALPQIERGWTHGLTRRADRVLKIR